MAVVVQRLRDLEFREKYKIKYVKLRKGFFDVLMGNHRKKIGRVCFSYGQWCFCPDVGDNFHYGSTRNDAVWHWMMTEGKAPSEEVQQ